MFESGAGAPVLRGLVLAGGRSKRLGRDKAAIVVGDQTMLERAIAILSGFVSDVRVAVRPDQMTESLRARFALVPDIAEEIGPAAGIIAAHRLFPDSAWLVLACDMPRVTRETLAMLVKQRDAARPATAFRAPADGLPEPLCAIYEPATLARFRREIEAGGDPGPRGWLVQERAVLLVPPGADALESINLPGDVERLGGR